MVINSRCKRLLGDTGEREESANTAESATAFITEERKAGALKSRQSIVCHVDLFAYLYSYFNSISLN
jgi:hypothetical protein